MPRLRVLTTNLLVDRADPGGVASMIDEYEPDVLAVQELGERSATVIMPMLPYGKLDPRPDNFGLGIASHNAITVEPLELAERPGWVARLDPDDWGLREPFTILNVHLTNPIDPPWGRSFRARRSQIAEIRSAVSSLETPYLIVGDMNSTPSWPEYRRLAELGTDAARATGTARPTWSHFLSGPRLLRIDHGFVSGATPVTTQTVAVAGSDHRALVIDLDV